MYSLFYAAELSGIGYAPNSGAKVLLFFDICKLFLHIARNQHEIAENIYKEDRKNCYAGSSFQFVRRVSLFTSHLFAPLPH